MPCLVLCPPSRRQHLALLLVIASAAAWVACFNATTSPAAAQHPTAATTTPAPLENGRRPTPVREEIRAIYFTGLIAGSPNGKRIASAWRSECGNAIVFDVKDSDGIISFASQQSLANHPKHPPIHDLAAWVAWLHAHGLYAIARQAVFKDERLVQEHPELAVHSRTTGAIWTEHGKPAWLDPSLPAVRDYNIGMALEVAAAGVDEIQFDYIRFPVEGNQKDCKFHYQTSDPRADIVTDYLYRAQKVLRPTGVHISIDVYGVMAWARDVDLHATGQDVLALSYFCDVLCPMIYPSHFFNNFDNYSNPGDAPEHFIRVALERFKSDTQDTGVTLRPWLQAFAWRTKSYSPEYIRIQVKTEHQEQGSGFMLWNARNDYRIPNQAMATMVTQPNTFFSGGNPYPAPADSTAKTAGQ
ncbi:MAG: putative glycoside hydrolase [Terriglobales bacterium]